MNEKTCTTCKWDKRNSDESACAFCKDCSRWEADPAKVALDKALTALRGLVDEQNGPPLERRKAQWQAAMDKATKLLEEHGR